jgi:opacity protein-like surface antigen
MGERLPVGDICNRKIWDSVLRAGLLVSQCIHTIACLEYFMSQPNSAYRIKRIRGRWVRPLAKIFFAVATPVMLTLSTSVMAQEQARTHSVEIFGGEQFGDNLTDTPVLGRTPRLNDNAVVGGRYNYNFTEMWAVQLSAGYSPTRAARVPSGHANLGLTTVDLDAVWNITPQYPIVVYVLAGAGYAWAHLDNPIAGTFNGRSVVLNDSNGYTANAGIGAKYYLFDKLYVDLQTRYRYLDRLVSDRNQHLNTDETTLGIGWRF